ncbi:MAG: hypothetical protein KF773_24795 [Deltaproteobacteria bacterium]|nr:hypothetical protein [Deltaproteobacteria bacterium]
MAFVVGCNVGPSTLPTQRPLVADQLPYLVDRADVQRWFLRNDWCRRRTWAQTDEFVICNPRPYLNPTTPAMYTLARYDDEGRVVAFAVFTPVPCRMYGRCDGILGRTFYAAEDEFVDRSNGLRQHLADRGRAVEPQRVGLPDMQQRMFDALTAELGHRFGRPTWQDDLRYGVTWASRTSEVGLFVAGNGGWLVETHEIRGAPPGAVRPLQTRR